MKKSEITIPPKRKEANTTIAGKHPIFRSGSSSAIAIAS